MKHAEPQEAPASPRIGTLDSLREHLQWAIELEHATLPPYLCALYSLDPERNPEAVQVVGSVFVEEMLHLALAANLLNAVGGRPLLDTPRMLAPYPRTLPHGDPSLEVSLVPFGAEALEMFLRLEQPAPSSAPPEDDRYETIVEQGEGTARGAVWDGNQDAFHPERDEVAHYYRFQELKLGRRYQRGDTSESGPTGEKISVDLAGVRPMGRNPRPAVRGSAIRTAQEEFNRTYCDLLQLLEQAFNGSPKQLADATRAMFTLKAEAQALMRMPDGEGVTAGPTFEYVPRESRR